MCQQHAADLGDQGAGSKKGALLRRELFVRPLGRMPPRYWPPGHRVLEGARPGRHGCHQSRSSGCHQRHGLPYHVAGVGAIAHQIAQPGKALSALRSGVAHVNSGLHYRCVISKVLLSSLGMLLLQLLNSQKSFFNVVYLTIRTNFCFKPCCFFWIDLTWWLCIF